MITTAPDVVKTNVWNTWTGGPVASAHGHVATRRWHPTKGDPQSTLHKSENHTVGVPYFVAPTAQERRRVVPLERG